MQDLIASYDKYEELLGKAHKGTEYYRKLAESVNKTLERCRAECKVRREEREMLLARFAPKGKSHFNAFFPVPLHSCVSVIFSTTLFSSFSICCTLSTIFFLCVLSFSYVIFLYFFLFVFFFLYNPSKQSILSPLYEHSALTVKVNSCLKSINFSFPQVDFNQSQVCLVCPFPYFLPFPLS